MQHENPVAVVRDWQEAVNEQDVDRLLALSDPEVAISGPRGSGYGSARRLLVDWISRAGLRLRALQTFARGGTVVVAQHGTWRSPETGKITGESGLATCFLVKDGIVVQLARHDGSNGLHTALKESGLGHKDEVL